MAVHIHNISLVVMVNNFEPSWFLHATAKEMHLDGSILHNTKSLVVTASLNDAQTKMLRHYPAIKKYSNEQSHTKPCLVELSFGIALDGVLLAKGTPSLEKIQLNVNDTKAVVHGGFYDFLRDAKVHKKNLAKLARPVRRISIEKTPKLNEENPMADDDFYDRISPIIPKVICI